MRNIVCLILVLSLCMGFNAHTQMYQKYKPTTKDELITIIKKLGGANIYGGEGSIKGTVLAVILIQKRLYQSLER